MPLFAQGCAATPNSTGTAGSRGGRGAAWSPRRPTATRDPSSTSSGSAGRRLPTGRAEVRRSRAICLELAGGDQVGHRMTEAAGSSSGPSPRDWSPGRRTATHLRPPSRPRRTRTACASRWPGAPRMAMSIAPSTAQRPHCNRFKSKNEETSERLGRQTAAERQRIPGDACGAPVCTRRCAKCVPCVISFSYHSDLSKDALLPFYQ